MISQKIFNKLLENFLDMIVKKNELCQMTQNKSDNCTEIQVPDTVQVADSKTNFQLVAIAPLAVKCQVCGTFIEVFVEKSLPTTVKCNRCNNYTPVIKAPPKYKYLRCSACNYLSVAKKRPVREECRKCEKVMRKCQTYNHDVNGLSEHRQYCDISTYDSEFTIRLFLCCCFLYFICTCFDIYSKQQKL